MNAAIGGWMISGTMFYRSGFPFSIIDGGATAGLVGNNLGGTSSFGATILAQPLPTFTQRNFSNGRACVLVACFSAADFATSTDFMGDVGRNAFRGPGFLGGDLSVRKNFASHRANDFPDWFERLQLVQPCELWFALSEH